MIDVRPYLRRGFFRAAIFGTSIACLLGELLVDLGRAIIRGCGRATDALERLARQGDEP